MQSNTVVGTKVEPGPRYTLPITQAEQLVVKIVFNEVYVVIESTHKRLYINVKGVNMVPTGLEPATPTLSKAFGQIKVDKLS